MSDPDRSAAAILRLDQVTRRLRVECPWDRSQDQRSIVPHTVEEAYELADAAASGDDAKLLDELADAAASGDDAKLLDELGDVLFQVHFLALLLEERDAGDLAAVATQMTEKLVRRHPHVFGEVEVEDSAEVLANWDRIKQEKEGRVGLFADVPENLPALLYARKIQRRAVNRAGAGADLGVSGAESAEAVIGALHEALDRLGALAASGASAAAEAAPEDRDRVEEGLGELLFAVVDVARRLGCDPELALRAAASRFRASAAADEA